MGADEIVQLKRRLVLYEEHHRNCSLITPEGRASLGQALRTSHPTPQRTGTPRLNLRSSSHDSSVFNTPNRTRKRTQNSTGDDASSKKVKGKSVANRYPPDDAATQELSLSLQKLNEGSLSMLGSTVTTEPSTIPREPAQAWAVIGRGEQVHAQACTVFGRGQFFANQTSSFIKTADLTNALARLVSFFFLSYVVVLENLKLLSADACDKLVGIVLDSGGASEYLRRIRAGAKKLHQLVIAELLRSDWTIGQATFLLAFCTSCYHC
jgi:hypothetical protein